MLQDRPKFDALIPFESSPSSLTRPRVEKEEEGEETKGMLEARTSIEVGTNVLEEWKKVPPHGN